MATIPAARIIPWKEEAILSGNPEELADYLKLLIRELRSMYEEIANVVNLNEKPEYVAQDAQPTPEKGKLIIWKDTDAGAGNPTHYLVYNDDGTIRTWGSDQTA